MAVEKGYLMIANLNRMIHHSRCASLVIRFCRSFAYLVNTGNIRSLAENSVKTNSYAIRLLSNKLSRLGRFLSFLPLGTGGNGVVGFADESLGLVDGIARPQLALGPCRSAHQHRAVFCPDQTTDERIRRKRIM